MSTAFVVQLKAGQTGATGPAGPTGPTGPTGPQGAQGPPWPGAAAVAMAALNIDWSLSGVYTKTLAAGANAITFSNQASGMVIIVRLTGAASTVSWPAGIKWPGGAAPTQTASGTDVYTFVHDGTSVYGSVVQAMA